MHSFDLYSERQMRDARSDQMMSGPAFHREINGLVMAELVHQKRNPRGLSMAPEEQGFGQKDRDQMAFASILFCSPFMLFCLGSTFSVVDQLNQLKPNQMDDSLRNRLHLLKSEYANKSDPEAKIKLALSADVENRLFGQPGKRPTAQTEFLHKNGEIRRRWSAKERNWTKTNKLLKQKQAILDDLERFRGNLPANVVTALLAKIEQLDKNLKELGSGT